MQSVSSAATPHLNRYPKEHVSVATPIDIVPAPLIRRSWSSGYTSCYARKTTRGSRNTAGRGPLRKLVICRHFYSLSFCPNLQLIERVAAAGGQARLADSRSDKCLSSGGSKAGTCRL